MHLEGRRAPGHSNHMATVQANDYDFPRMAIVIRNYHMGRRGTEYREQFFFSGTSADEPKLLARDVLLSGTGLGRPGRREGRPARASVAPIVALTFSIPQRPPLSS
jgi:hypothetical protein